MDPADQLLRTVESRWPQASRRVYRAIRVAKAAHQGQKRKTGEPFVEHPLRVALRVASMQHAAVDVPAVIAAILHDTVEDTELSQSDVEQVFGADVAGIVGALTDAKEGSDRDERFYEQIRAAAEKDTRVWLVKLADVADNAQTLAVHEPERRSEIVKQISERYIPQARALHLAGIEADLLRATRS